MSVMPETSDAHPSSLRAALNALQITKRGVTVLQAAVASGELGRSVERAIELIAGAKGRLIVTGVGKSGHIGRKLAATFASTGTPAYFVHATEASHGDLGMVGNDDVILALSWSGETAELASVLTYAKRFSVPLIAMTAGAKSTLAKAATLPLILPRAREACPHNLAPTTSTVLQLALGDAIAMAVMTHKGFTDSDFQVFHPGGKLGARLRRVGDIMHGTDKLPLLSEEARITDGDLRRFIEGDMRRPFDDQVMMTPVTSVMTRNPVTISPGMLAAEALEMLQSRKVSVLFAVEGSRPVGILHTLDLLRAGVA